MKTRPSVGSIVLYQKTKVYIIREINSDGGLALLSLDGGGWAWAPEEEVVVLHSSDTENVSIISRHKTLRKNCEYWLKEYQEKEGKISI